MFISFEGIDGSGKSTQARLLADRLRALGHETVLTREPGGSDGAEQIRALLVEGGQERWSPETELLLFNAARRDHVERLIRPALDRGAWVVSDRFADSSRVYQGAGGGTPESLIEALDDAVVNGDQPDLTLVFDLPVEVGLDRAFGRGLFETRFESKGLAFHQKLRDGFLQVAERHPERCVVLDATGEVDDVSARLWAVVEERLL